jgi:hypothetical protein
VSSIKIKEKKTALIGAVKRAKGSTKKQGCVVHFMPNRMWRTVALCSTEPHGKGSYKWDEVTCKKCLELKDEI